MLPNLDTPYRNKPFSYPSNHISSYTPTKIPKPPYKTKRKTISSPFSPPPPPPSFTYPLSISPQLNSSHHSTSKLPPPSPPLTPTQLPLPPLPQPQSTHLTNKKTIPFFDLHHRQRQRQRRLIIHKRENPRKKEKKKKRKATKSRRMHGAMRF
ncbi:hypothetical protein N7G274_001664 [Stereocaulon virgatum]|uniref:Uncharacterized protein n=1 Tax=Stereocaulon virgatum TaxID=373712 RepID=A0ABR4ANC3_9LECA